MRKIILLAMALGFLVSGCMASFPAKYDPKFAMNPQLGKDQRVYAIAKFENAFGKEVKDSSLKLQVLVDRKIDEWGFLKDKNGKHLDITVKNVVKAGSMTGSVLTGILCGLSLYIIPAIAVDHYRMAVIVTEEGKELAKYTYEGSITTYTEIAFIFWGLFVFAPMDAIYKTEENMLDHFFNDLASGHKPEEPVPTLPEKPKPIETKSKEDRGEILVFVWWEGRFYHILPCPAIKAPYMYSNGRYVKLKDAEKQGYKPCPHCIV